MKSIRASLRLLQRSADKRPGSTPPDPCGGCSNAKPRLSQWRNRFIISVSGCPPDTLMNRWRIFVEPLVEQVFRAAEVLEEPVDVPGRAEAALSVIDLSVGADPFWA
jgi:hypothetical protein